MVRAKRSKRRPETFHVGLSERERAVYESAFPPKPRLYRPTLRERIGYRIDVLRYRIAQWIWPSDE